MRILLSRSAEDLPEETIDQAKLELSQMPLEDPRIALCGGMVVAVRLDERDFILERP